MARLDRRFERLDRRLGYSDLPVGRGPGRVLSGDDLSVTNEADAGIVPIAQYIFSAGNPAHHATIAIGPDTYQFCVLATSDQVTNDAYIGVVRAGTAQLTQDNLIAAINATYSPNENPSIFQTDGTTPALANGTSAVFGLGFIALKPYFYLYTADAPGGTITPRSESLALSASVDVWSIANLNEGGGAVEGYRAESRFSVLITAEMETWGELRFRPGWGAAPSDLGGLEWSVYAAGVQKITADTLTVDATVLDAVEMVLSIGGAPNIVAGDTVVARMWSTPL